MADELGHTFEFVNLPYEVAQPAYPTLQHHSSEHRVVDTARILTELGYADQVAPLDRTAPHGAVAGRAPGRRPRAHQEDAAGSVRLRRRGSAGRHLAALHEDCAAVPPSNREPGYGVAYYGPLPNPGDRQRGI